MKQSSPQAHYYLLKNKVILRLEADDKWNSLPSWIKAQSIEKNPTSMNQDQANYRVVIFRDQIIELSEFTENFALDNQEMI